MSNLPAEYQRFEKSVEDAAQRGLKALAAMIRSSSAIDISYRIENENRKWSGAIPISSEAEEIDTAMFTDTDTAIPCTAIGLSLKRFFREAKKMGFVVEFGVAKISNDPIVSLRSPITLQV